MKIFAQLEARPTGTGVVLTIPSHKTWRVTGIGFSSAPSNGPIFLTYQPLNGAPLVNSQQFAAPNASTFAAAVGASDGDPNGSNFAMFRLTDITLPEGSEIDVSPQQPASGWTAIFVIEEN